MSDEKQDDRSWQGQAERWILRDDDPHVTQQKKADPDDVKEREKEKEETGG